MRYQPSPSGCVPRRRGIALILAMVTLAVLFVIMTVVTRHTFASRQMLERRENHYQALCLAQSGLEIAAARLLVDGGSYQGESLEIVPRSKLRIDVKNVGKASDTFQVTAEAHFPTDIPHPSLRTLTRTYRRSAEGKRWRLEVVAQSGLP